MASRCGRAQQGVPVSLGTVRFSHATQQLVAAVYQLKSRVRTVRSVSFFAELFSSARRACVTADWFARASRRWSHSLLRQAHQEQVESEALRLPGRGGLQGSGSESHLRSRWRHPAPAARLPAASGDRSSAEFDEDAPRGCRQMQPNRIRPFQRQESAEEDEQHECQMQ